MEKGMRKEEIMYFISRLRSMPVGGKQPTRRGRAVEKAGSKLMFSLL